MTSFIEYCRAVHGKLRALIYLLLLLAAACSPERVLEAPLPAPATRVGLALSLVSARPGDTIAVLVRASRADGAALRMVQGVLRFDPAALRFVGQPLTGETMVVVGDTGAERGTLRVLSLRVGGLAPVTADLRFLVSRGGYASSLGYRMELAAGSETDASLTASLLPTVELPAPAGPPPRRLSVIDWAKHFGLDTAESRVHQQSAGDAALFGDLTQNGSINGLDVLAIANVAVGNRPLLTDPTKDYAIAGDVSPANLPGLGEASDPVPPGQELDGSHILNGLDALAIANESVGNDRDVAGEPIPGHTPRPFRVVLSGLLTASRTLTRDTVYELQGNVIVGPGATLTIGAGTRVEGDAATRGALVAVRAGNLNWRGTRLEPIVFTCNAPAPSPGCWGGVVVNGLALLNNRDPGTTGFCPEKFSIGTSELYGGCLVEDTTGVIQYVRVEYGGQAIGATAEPGLALLGVGYGTTIDHIQVHGSLGDGIYLSGGNVNLRFLALTGNLGASLHWDHGWGGNGLGGNAQFVQIQVPVGGGDAIVGSNFLTLPNAGPRSEPDLYHVTAVGAGVGGGAGRGLVLENGTVATVRDAVFLQMAGAGFDVQGVDSCGLASAGMIALDHNIFFGNTPDFSADTDCFDEVAFAGAAAQQNRITDPGLIAATNTLTPDFRPSPGSAATTGSVATPSNFFFDLSAVWIGANGPSNVNGTNVPWYAGWTRGWSGMTP